MNHRIILFNISADLSALRGEKNMRVKDITCLCMSFNRITIKARMSIFGKYRDIMITSFLVKNGRANIDDDNLVLLSEDVI